MIPSHIGLQLKDLLPKGGLLLFLQKYPNFFKVTFTGEMNRKQKPTYTFKMIERPTVAAAPPAVGGGSSSGESHHHNRTRATTATATGIDD